MPDDNDLDISNFFSDDESIDIFKAQIDESGVVASIVEDSGVLVGFTADKLREFLKLAEAQEDKVLLILLDGSPPSSVSNDDGILN
jgi:hypothetical protein